jgi:hypothetical protein
MFHSETLRDFSIFLIAMFGVGAALAPAMIRDPLSRVCAGIVFAIGGYFIAGFTGFALGASNAVTASVVGTGIVVLLIVRRRTVCALIATPEVKQFIVGWIVFSVWSVALLALVRTYSGGGWAVDWVEHWQRTQFFLERQPLETRFAVIYPLTARPPLVNLLIALALEGGGRAFADFQLVLTLLGTLVLLPTWILVRTFTARRSVGWWAVLVLMINPLVAENLTFAWTKLPTVFLVLAGVLFASPTAEPRTRSDGIIAALCVSLAALAHYSAVPWIIAIALAGIVARRSIWNTARFWHEAAIVAGVFAIPVALWAGWATLKFGWHGVTSTNTTATAWQEQNAIQHLSVPLRNLFDTLVPFPLRGEPADGLITQASQLGRLRDVAFNLYQLNLPLAFGFAGLWVITVALFRPRKMEPDVPIGLDDARDQASRMRTLGSSSIQGAINNRVFYGIVVSVALALGIAAHTPRDQWGLVHICLQPLVLLGLVRVAALLPGLAPARIAMWGMLAAVDLLLGVGIQFGIESGAFTSVPITSLSRAAVANANDKAAFHFEFFADRVGAPAWVLALWLALCLGYVIFRIRSAHAASRL